MAQLLVIHIQPTCQLQTQTKVVVEYCTDKTGYSSNISSLFCWSYIYNEFYIIARKPLHVLWKMHTALILFARYNVLYFVF